MLGAAAARGATGSDGGEAPAQPESSTTTVTHFRIPEPIVSHHPFRPLLVMTLLVACTSTPPRPRSGTRARSAGP